jgi:hypothetical protein
MCVYVSVHMGAQSYIHKKTQFFISPLSVVWMSVDQNWFTVQKEYDMTTVNNRTHINSFKMATYICYIYKSGCY